MDTSEHKSISAKISREEFTRIEEYCKKKDITLSSLIRDLLLKEIKVTVPHHIAGSNKIVYNRNKDNFSWVIELENGESSEVIKNVSANYLEELNEKIVQELILRDYTMKKTDKSTVPVPSSIMKRKNE